MKACMFGCCRIFLRLAKWCFLKFIIGIVFKAK
jgi:hypothetical protein